MAKASIAARTVSSIAAAWRRGLMHGAGEISLPNGDHYKGPFRNGAPHGDGAYIDAEGVIYQGGFANGLRDGDGLVRRPDDLVYKATWRAGAELAETREEVTTPGLRYAALEDEVVVRVTVENLYNATEQYFEGVSSDASTFQTSANGETLVVRPGNPRILDVWEGPRADPFGVSRRGEPRQWRCVSLASGPNDLKPASLVFEFENRSRDDIRIVGAFLDVAESIGDRAPHASRLTRAGPRLHWHEGRILTPLSSLRTLAGDRLRPGS